MDKRYLDSLELGGLPTSIEDEEKFIRAMFYGDFGSGKSSLALHIAEMMGGPIIWVTTDSAWRVIDKYPTIKKMTQRVPYNSLSQVAGIALAHSEGHPNYSHFKTLIWDAVSRGVDVTLRKLVDGKKYPKVQDDPDVECWPHYRRAERALSETVQILNKSKLNIIYTAHTKFPTDKDKEHQKFAIRPNMPEASYKIVGEEVSLIGWLHRDAVGNKRMIQTAGTKTVTAKSQIATIDETILEQSKIPNLIQQWKDAA